MKYVHFIITRFNLPIFQKRDCGESVDNINSAFLKDRFEIFERYCLPSIANQTCKNFKWLVMFDINTPKVFKERLKRLHHQFEQLIPCYLDVNAYNWDDERYISAYQDYYNKLSDKIPPPISSVSEIDNFTKCQYIVLPQFVHDMVIQNIPLGYQYDYIVTTRLDNDDALHKDYIARVQALIEEERVERMYNFLYGYQLNLNSGIVQKYCYPNSHFTTLVENKGTLFRSAFYGDHRFVKILHDVKDINTEPMWCELLHGKNVANVMSVSYKNRILCGFLSFDAKDFAYTGIRLSLLKTLKFVMNRGTTLALLRSVKHGIFDS